jgi:glucose-fructose oxidoreductase
MKTWKIVGINFDHMHMGDLLRLVDGHPNAEISGICDPDPRRMQSVIDEFRIPSDRVFTDVASCMKATQADIAILCPATGEHADYVEQVAPYGVHILVEKPFAASLADADRMIAAMAPTGREMMINWPLRWVASHITAKRLIDEGLIGTIKEVHYYDGNRGPLYHGADKVELEPTVERKAASWFYHADKGGGSLLDYLGYGVTLGTWFRGGDSPEEVTSLCHGSEGLEVDEHSVTIVRYSNGLSKFETRWGTFTDPWVHQPLPKCGFVLVGSEGTISSYDYEPTILVQTSDHPEGTVIEVDELPPENSNAIAYFIDCLVNGRSPKGPLSPVMARIGQQIVDTAFASAQQKRVLPLVK